jgi:spore germination protein KB
MKEDAAFMNPPNKLTSGQLASIFIATFTGSAIVYIPSPVTNIARNEAIVSMFLSYLFGLLVLSCTIYLNRVHEDRDYLQYSRLLTGKFISILLAIPVVGMLFFAIPGIIVGISDFLTSIMMQETPSYVFQSVTLIVACLTARAGMQVIGRMFVLLVAVLISFSLLVILLALPVYHPGFLLPLWPLEVKSVLHASLITFGFPFGEIMLFSMVLPYARSEQKSSVKKQLYIAVTATGFMLLISTICSIMAFGPAAGTFQYPLYELASEIQVAEIFQRIESVIGIALILGSYMKATLFLFILNQLLCGLTGIKDQRILFYPLCLVLILLCFTSFDNPADFYEQVYVIWPFTVLAAGCLPLFLLTGITAAKQLKGSKKNGGNPNGNQTA